MKDGERQLPIGRKRNNFRQKNKLLRFKRGSFFTFIFFGVFPYNEKRISVK